MLLWRLFLLRELKPTAVQRPSCSRETETLTNVKKPLRSLPLHTAIWNRSFASSRARSCRLAAAAAGTRLREAQGTGGQGGQHAAEPLCGGRSLASAISAARSSGRTTSCFLIVREQPLISRDNIFLPAPAAARPWAGEAISPRWRDVFQTQPCCLSALHFAYPLLGTTNQKKALLASKPSPPAGHAALPTAAPVGGGPAEIPGAHPHPVQPPGMLRVPVRRRCICTNPTGAAAVTPPDRQPKSNWDRHVLLGRAGKITYKLKN